MLTVTAPSHVTTSAAPAPPAPCRDLLTVTVDRARARVVLRGELDRDCAHHLLDALALLSTTGHRAWFVDAAEVTFCDAGGLRALAAGQDLAVRSGGELRLIGSSRCVDRLIALVGLDLPSTSAPEEPRPLPPVDLAGWRASRGRRSE